MTQFPLRRNLWNIASPVSLLTLSLLSSPSSIAADTSTEADMRQLHEKLLDRDKIIADLQERVSKLEQRISDDKARSTPAKTRAAAKAPAPAPAGPSAQTRTASAPPSLSPSPSPSPSAPASSPGTVDVDELAAERALERTLTAEGALLLPAGSYDLEPYFNYTRRVTNGPILVSEGGGVLVRNFEVQRNEFDLGLRARIGLPYETQLEFDLPYRSVDQATLLPLGVSEFNQLNNNGSSLGDVKLGVAKTLLRETDWQPDLVGRLTWDTDTGDAIDNSVALGIGFNELRASLVALKRQDPLAFTAVLAYQTTFEKDNIQPGDEISFSLGASLAASPQTSLSIALAQTFTSETQINGRNIAGSDQVSSILLFGASSTIGRQTLLSLTGAVGLTDDAPDYGINLSLPIRF